MVKVFNKTLKSQPFYIGETVIDLIPIMEKREQDAWFTIRDRGEFAGDVYIEFTFHPAGMPRTNLNRSNSRIITEVEEGISIMSLKDLQRDPVINPADFLGAATEPPKQPTIEAKLMSPPLQTSNSSASLSSMSSTPDSQLAPANESDLNSILDEIRSLVDYPYHVPAEELPSGPGALPSMRRKPLPQIPNNRRPSAEGYSIPQSSKVTHKIEGPFPAPRSKNYSVQPNQGIEIRTPSPPSQISDFILGTPVRLMNSSRQNAESMFSARPAPLQRRGSAESLSTYLEEPDDTLDFDPASEIKLVSSTAKSIRRRPMEAPSVMQSFAEPSNRRSPYPEDVRGRPIPYPYHPEGLPIQGGYPAQPRLWAPRPVAYRPVMVSRPLPRPRGYVIPTYPEYATRPEYAAPIYYSPRPHYAPVPHHSPMPLHHVHYPRPMPRPGMVYHPNMTSPVLPTHFPQPRGQRRYDLPEPTV
ncbi:hypothetical protein DSO57_1026437 [Entomophthora muscae]|nr:hypothetical protein DSO57_1026437 [Entomophthora muscae]